MKKTILLIFCLITWNLQAQTFQFAHIADTHVGGSTGAEDLQRTVDDLNQQSDIDFVILAGDVTEFGSATELYQAKEILSHLKMPYYVVPGNHDAKWSESGCNDFVRIFGSEGFTFEKNGILFIGTASGPNMRMAPGLVPREQIVYLDSILSGMKNPNQPIIFINHYPLDESLANWYEVTDLLKTRNIQLTLLGHGHNNKLFNFEGIPGVMGRSNLRAKEAIGGYNWVTVTADSITFAERNPGQKTAQPWCKLPLHRKKADADTTNWKRPDFSVNQKYNNIKINWLVEEKSDVGTAITTEKNRAIFANTKGEVVALSAKTGKTLWRFATGGKIYSTPAISNGAVVCASTDGNIYSLSLKSGQPIWKFETGKPIVASPAIDNGIVYIGSSEGKFRAINLANGQLIWQFDSVRNFVESKPLIENNQLFFGSWGNTFYALNAQTGTLVWQRQKHNNRMLSPAAVWPVAAHGKIFIVAPDRRMTALDARTGTEVWDSGSYSCRESIGISPDKALVFIKNMTEGKVMAFSTSGNEQKLVWECDANLGYEIGPSPITSNPKYLFVPTATGEMIAINQTSHEIVWRYKLTNALINGITPFGKKCVLATSLDGKIISLQFK